MKNRKYTAENLLPAFRLAARLRDEMIAQGFTDNGGAIHSAERILNILGMHLRYPELTHINGLKKLTSAERSAAATVAIEIGETVVIEHVAPIRALTRLVIDLCREGQKDEAILDFIGSNYRLVLLTPEEMKKLNKQNRSEIRADRLETVGVFMDT